ncbi:ATP-dependent RNA helicase DEAH11, chloroplastic-like [Myzus persicae]|uniref:ATP-dependent RNA helicase DEAH11, chloroplastic-like n=1 Tax=Myzus persicae TaxID=13164 RepID=UPI000B92FFC2|nr:ATP-dependent RNA helicase DEAH11, chloroplastic-like [Myzus persicae]XP_022167897.1 ATP-dependent RNA helicase DEAH11, chloroplastic-like [Myzus persicae]
MAEVVTISEKENTLAECIAYPKFENYGWQTLYKQYMSNVIKTLHIHSDISRLYLLIKLDETMNNLDATLIKLQYEDILTISPDAVQLTTNLKDIIPEADPIYLDLVGEFYVNNDNNLYEFIGQITTNKKYYPRIKEYNDHVNHLGIVQNLRDGFNVQEFLKMCPDPVNYFKNIKLNSCSTHFNESLSYLSDRFNLLSMAKIRTEFIINKYNLSNTVESLLADPSPVHLKNKRKSFGNRHSVNYKTTENVEFLKEIAYLDHKDEILNYIESIKTVHRIQVEQAKSIGELNTCGCCFDNELLTSEVFSCPAGHMFCSACIKKGTEVAVGGSKVDIKCFADCGEEFNLTMIKSIVDDKLYQRIMRLKQAQEIKAAGIEGLETCAFCDYSVILSPDLKIINCLNPECKKETCRQCREESHFPYRCDQIEKAPEVQVRTMIENKMTEVLIRICYNCKRKFVKEDGCNKMTCSCGKQMCYICRQPVNSNYAHFYHQTVMENKCPLYTDENIVHTTAVEAAARLIINELKLKKPDLLKNIDINKILPALKKSNNSPNSQVSALDVNKVVATVIGQNVEDINNLKDMRSLEPKVKKPRY